MSPSAARFVRKDDHVAIFERTGRDEVIPCRPALSVVPDIIGVAIAADRISIVRNSDESVVLFCKIHALDPGRAVDVLSPSEILIQKFLW